MSEWRKKRKVYFILYRMLYTHKKLKVLFDFVCLVYGWLYVKKRKKEEEKKRFHMSVECIYINEIL